MYFLRHKRIITDGKLAKINRVKMKTPKQLASRSLPVLLVGMFLLSFSFAPFSTRRTEAESVDQLKAKSAQLQKEIDANKAQAEALKAEGDTLKAAIGSLDIQIQQSSTQIELTTTKIKQLQIELDNAQKELDRQKSLLKANMRALYKRGDASSVELLVGSDSFSQYIDEQEYLERLKVGIQESTDKVIKLKQQIAGQQEEQKQQLKILEASKKALDDSRANRASLLAQTQGQEAAYRGKVEELKKQQAAAESALARALNSGSYRVASVGPVSAGDVVGSIGSTGLSSGPHLHLEVRSGNGVINPAPYIQSKPINMPPGWISQAFGNPDPIYARGYHPGIDYAGPAGAPIFAIASGHMYRGCSNQMLGTSRNEYGYVAIIEHSNGTKSVYAHMSGGPAACNYNTYY